MVRVEPMNGSIHKLLLKVKAITNVSVKLTNQLNNPIDLNGLDFDISLKMDFIDERELKQRPTMRELFDKFSNIQQTTQPRIVQNPRPDRLEEDKKEEAEGSSGDKKESTKKKKTKK